VVCSMVSQSPRSFLLFSVCSAGSVRDLLRLNRAYNSCRASHYPTLPPISEFRHNIPYSIFRVHFGHEFHEWTLMFLCPAIIRDLCKTPPFGQSLRCVQILILEIFNIFLWLKSSRVLILNEIEHFSKVPIRANS